MPNQSVQGTTTFAFVPYRRVTYTVTASMQIFCYTANYTSIFNYTDTLAF
jgi:hypothetical protein